MLGFLSRHIRKKPRLCVIIFEGRTGSSELISRLNSHPNILFFPEILHEAANPDDHPKLRWERIDQVIDDAAYLRPINTDLASYQKNSFEPANIQVVGLKTRLNELSDNVFFEAEGKRGNFYVVQGDRLLATLKRHNALLIRLRRRDVLKIAVSWHRAVALNNLTNQWNVTKALKPLGPISIDPEALIRTMQWVISCRNKHDAAFDNYRGKKIAIDYEDMLHDWPNVQRLLLKFLDVPKRDLTHFYKKATSDDLSDSVLNLTEIKKAIHDQLRAWQC